MAVDDAIVGDLTEEEGDLIPDTSWSILFLKEEEGRGDRSFCSRV